MMILLGIIFLGAAGACLHDVPFTRFVLAMILISFGQSFLVLGMK